MTRKLLGLCLAALLMPFSPVAARPDAAPPPVSHAEPSVTAWQWDGRIGFDWTARADHTPVRIDAAKAVHEVPLDLVGTSFLDVEVRGLPANLPVRIARSDGHVREDATYADGNLVVWHLPAAPLTVVVSEARTGKPLTTAVLKPPTLQRDSPADVKGTGALARPCGSCGDPGSQWTDPYGYTYVRTRTAAYLNGVKSFTSDIVARIDACWEHSNTIFAKVSGGLAGQSGSAGGTRTAVEMVCSGTSSTAGVGQISGPIYEFEKDTYADGSYKVWSPAGGYGHSSVTWNWNPPKCCYTLEFQNCATNPGQYYSVMERHSGSITISAAWSAFGVSGDAGTTSTDTNTATLRFECKADNAFHRYTFLVVAGDGRRTGMIGAIWKEF